MTRILIISSFPPPNDGIGEHTRNLALAWTALGHDVLIMAPGRGTDSSSLADGGLRISRTIRVLSQVRANKCLISFDPDLVFCQFAISGLTTSLFSVIRLCRLARKVGAKIALGFHESSRELALLGALGSILIRSAAKTSDLIFAFSSGELTALKSLHLGRQLVRVPLGTPEVKSPTGEDLARIRRKYSILDIPSVLSIGFIHADKGVDRLIEVAQRVTQQVPHVKFIIAGCPRRRRGVFRPMGFVDTRHFKSLQRRARLVGGSVEIEFIGFISEPDLIPLLSEVTVIAMPYRKITQSAIASFACAASAPVVATDLVGFREVFGLGAQYVDPNDFEQFSSALVEVLIDHSLRDSMKQELRDRSQKESFAAVASAILEAAF